jgi:methionyl-tRNA formyltransferase
MKVYSKQLSQGKMLSRNSKFGIANTVSADSVTISSEGKRQTIIDKVAANIVDKIITEGPKEENEAQITDQIERELGKKINFSKDKTQFTYTTIDDNNNKTTKTLSVEDSQFVVKRMTELARQVADNNMEA